MRPDDWPAALGHSFAALTGQPLLSGADPAAPGYAAALAAGPLPIVAHDTQADPVFAWANAAALALWQMDFASFTRLPSRRSAAGDPATQDQRSRYLATAAAQGFVSDYSGLRVSATGQRFAISQTWLWTVRWQGAVVGQAARIGQVTPL